MWFGEDLLGQTLGAFPNAVALSLKIVSVSWTRGTPASQGGGIDQMMSEGPLPSVLAFYISSPVQKIPA